MKVREGHITSVLYGRAYHLPEVALFAILVGVYLAVPQEVPATTATGFDNLWMGEKTARLAADGPAALVALNDPWFRYVPQAILATVIGLGAPSVQDALLANALWIRFLEGIVLPGTIYAVVWRWRGRRTAVGTLAVLAVVRVGTLALSILGPYNILDHPPKLHVDLINVTGWDPAWITLVPYGWQLLLFPILGTTVWVALQYDLPRWVVGYCAALAVGALLFSLNIWISMGERILWWFGHGQHWYWGLTLPFIVGSVGAAHQSVTARSRRWAVASGALLGLTASIQLAHGAIAAAAVATALVAHQRYRDVVVAAVSAVVVWSPTLVIAALSRGWYQSNGSRVISDAAGVPTELLVVGIGALGLVALAHRLDDVDPAQTTVVFALLGAWLMIHLLATVTTGYWTFRLYVVVRPLLVIFVGISLVGILQRASEDVELPY